MTRHIYGIKYRRRDDPFGRVYRMTVQARNADEAREYARIRDEKFGTTTESPKRRGTVEPDEVEWRGTRVEVVD